MIRERRLFLEAVRLAVSVEVDLRIRSFTTVLAGLNVSSDTGLCRPPDEVVSPAIIRRAIHRAYRVVPFTPTCLKESLIFCRLARRRGYSTVLRIGVQKANGLLRAHAWVEDRSGAVLTHPLERYVPMPLPGQEGVG